MEDKVQQEIAQRAELVDAHFSRWFREFRQSEPNAIDRLVQSMEYAVMAGGKRFRPVLALLVGESLKVSAEKILPWGAAVEMIHAYSLIHDDLPCMDNDDMRRGKPTTHKAFDEATALLAGDALLTEAFGHIASSYPERAGELVRLLSRGAGVLGMVGGQTLDMAAETSDVPPELPHLRQIHALKTGALIRTAIEGAAVAAGATPEQRSAFRAFGEELGLAFQIADDILDADQEGQDGRSFVFHMGLAGAREELTRVSDRAWDALLKVQGAHPMLFSLVDWNRQRLA